MPVDLYINWQNWRLQYKFWHSTFFGGGGGGTHQATLGGALLVLAMSWQEAALWEVLQSIFEVLPKSFEMERNDKREVDSRRSCKLCAGDSWLQRQGLNKSACQQSNPLEFGKKPRRSENTPCFSGIWQAKDYDTFRNHFCTQQKLSRYQIQIPTWDWVAEFIWRRALERWTNSSCETANCGRAGLGREWSWCPATNPGDFPLPLPPPSISCRKEKDLSDLGVATLDT